VEASVTQIRNPNPRNPKEGRSPKSEKQPERALCGLRLKASSAQIFPALAGGHQEERENARENRVSAGVRELLRTGMSALRSPAARSQVCQIMSATVLPAGMKGSTCSV
jgi:hypothetical protein